MKTTKQNTDGNDYAVAKAFNEEAAALIIMVVAANVIGLPENFELTDLNRAYVLVTDELQRLYRRNEDLSAIEPKPIWTLFEVLESSTWEINEYFESLDDNNIIHAHIAKVNRLCIISGKNTPDLSPEQAKLLDYAETIRLNYGKLLEEVKIENKERQKNDWYIPAYILTQKPDGTLLINDTIVLKKPHASSATDNLLEQALKRPQELFVPDLGKTSRNLSTILSSAGFTPVLRALFFPVVRTSKGIMFRPTITRDQADEESINTTELDLRLKELGADIQHGKNL